MSAANSSAGAQGGSISGNETVPPGGSTPLYVSIGAAIVAFLALILILKNK